MYTRNDIGYDNVTVNSVGGFALMSSKRIMCRDNTARDNIEFGILLNVCEGCTVRSNLVEGVHNPKGKAAQQELQRLAEADRAFDCSFDMAVGYGLDAATDDERKADFRAVRGLE